MNELVFFEMNKIEMNKVGMKAASHRRPQIVGAFLAALVLLCLVATGQAPAMANQQGLGPSLDQTLPNGLRVVVFEDRRAPTALHMVWIKAGSMDEQIGKTGLAHVLEHMMFKGTKTLAPGEFSRRVAALGGRENAFTSREFTGYFQQLHKDALFDVMALEADRMQNLRFLDEEFVKEILVVMEERRLRTDDSPSGLAYEALMSRAFVSSSVRHPIVGWMADLKALKADDARQWYDQWYAPNNATVVVAGDVDAKAVFEHVSKLYKDWAAKPLPTPPSALEPKQLGAREAQVSAPAENAFFFKAWKAPTLGPTDGPLSTDNPKARDVVALSVLATLLDHPNFGRLQRSLIRESRRAVSFGTQADAVSRGPGLFMVEATPATGTGVREVLRDVEAEIAKISSQGVDQDELDLIRLQAKASQVYKQDSLFSKAMEAGRLLTAGRPISDATDWLKVLDDIRPDDVQRVAASYLREDQSTLIELLPQPVAGAAPRGFSSTPLRH
jgi:zinc protease